MISSSESRKTGIARVRRVEDGGERLLRRHLDREADNLRARHHHVRRLLVGEVEDLVEHLPLVVLDLALLVRDVEEHLQLGLREWLGVRRPRVETERRCPASLERCSTQITV